MALKSTIFKAQLAVSDLDRGHFATYPLTLARHPSETDERLMVRLIAFALFASEHLTFGRGLSDADDADLCEIDLTGAIQWWIEVGQPDARALSRALSRSSRVAVVTYGRQIETWWGRIATELAREISAGRLVAVALDEADSRELAAGAARSMQIACTLQEGALYLDDGSRTLVLTPRWLSAAALR